MLPKARQDATGNDKIKSKRNIEKVNGKVEYESQTAASDLYRSHKKIKKLFTMDKCQFCRETVRAHWPQDPLPQIPEDGDGVWPSRGYLEALPDLSESSTQILSMQVNTAAKLQQGYYQASIEILPEYLQVTPDMDINLIRSSMDTKFLVEFFRKLARPGKVELIKEAILRLQSLHVKEGRSQQAKIAELKKKLDDLPLQIKTLTEKNQQLKRLL